MFHKVKAVTPLPGYHLSVQFAEGVTKTYDLKPLFMKWPQFIAIKKRGFRHDSGYSCRLS